MTASDRAKYLRIALFLVGVIFIVGIYPLTIIWPSGWSWHTGQSEYLQMILGIYATLGVFLLIASRNLWIPKTPSGLKMQVLAPFVRSSWFPR